MGVTTDKQNDDKKVNQGLWANLLKEVSGSVRTPDSTLLLLGREGIGKRTLLQALLTHATPSAAAEADAMTGHSRSVALDFSYFGVRDPASSRDSVCPATCSVALLEEPQFEWLLRERLQPEQLRHTAAVICLDLKEPWTMMEDLLQWIELLQKLVGDLMARLPLAEQDALRAKVAAAVSEYKEPTEAQGSASGKAEQQHDEAGAAAPQEPKATEGSPTALVCNVGVPVIILVMRSDAASALETQKTKGWAQVIEAHLRQKALNFGAAIIYTMVQATKTQNVDVLFAYLMHRMYGYPLKVRPQVPSRDALFLPAGWDSRQKVEQVAATFDGGLNLPFESVITAPVVQASAEAEKEQAEDMNTFLQLAMSELKKLGSVPATKQPRLEAGSAPAALSSPSHSRNSTSGVAQAPPTPSGSEQTSATTAVNSPKKGAAKEGGSNADLSNFFQNLLTRTQQPGAATRPALNKATTSAALDGGGAAPQATIRKSQSTLPGVASGQKSSGGLPTTKEEATEGEPGGDSGAAVPGAAAAAEKSEADDAGPS
mmetsp:Transcript_48055/g.88527  ORF Transcript_48055/g.88527 Transcript_48055/m.88527 type:complete len:543 (-) Transcript_48055:65-1693(-)